MPRKARLSHRFIKLCILKSWAITSGKRTGNMDHYQNLCTLSNTPLPWQGLNTNNSPVQIEYCCSVYFNVSLLQEEIFPIAPKWTVSLRHIYLGLKSCCFIESFSFSLSCLTVNSQQKGFNIKVLGAGS